MDKGIRGLLIVMVLFLPWYMWAQHHAKYTAWIEENIVKKTGG